MVFDVTKASERNYKSRVEIKTLQDLITFMEFHEGDVIISQPCSRDGNYELCIYDDYVE